MLLVKNLPNNGGSCQGVIAYEPLYGGNRTGKIRRKATLDTILTLHPIESSAKTAMACPSKKTLDKINTDVLFE